MMVVTRDNVWKWIAGGLASMMVSNFATAMVFRTTDRHVIDVVKSNFTDISNGAGMYALEGRYRIEKIEKTNSDMRVKLEDVRTRLTRIESKMDQLLSRP